MTDIELTPEFGAGIAAGFPGDKGIEAHPDVIFFENFEGYDAPEEMLPKWSRLSQGPGPNRGMLYITSAENDVFHGTKALEFRHEPKDVEHANGVTKDFTEEEYDVFFLRWYQKYGEDYEVKGTNHTGAEIAAHYYDVSPSFDNAPKTPGGSWAGVASNGYNKFDVCLDFWSHGTPGNPYYTDHPVGCIHMYLYHPGQYYGYGDQCRPTGYIYPPSDPLRMGDWGPNFVPRPDFSPEPGRWYCYEIMVRANTVIDTGSPTELPGSNGRTTKGVNDGRVTIWVDGKIAADFPDLILRHREDLKIDRVNIGFLMGKDVHKKTVSKFVDQVVMARSYIGPLAST